jgi:hypothetical protein
MSIKSFFVLPSDPKYRSRIIQAIGLCVFVLYGFRALQAEIVRWGFFAEIISLCFGGLVLVGLVYWSVLLFYGFRAMLTLQPNGLLFFVLVIGAFFAWYTPEPPLREEMKLTFNRSRYEQIVEQGRSSYASGKNDCIELADNDKDLAWTCVIVEGNFAKFDVYPDVFSLVYSYDEQAPTAADCDWNGYVWKRIDKNWFICRSG